MLVPFVKYWVPVIVWILSIFIGSGDVMSAEHTSRFLIPFLHWIKPDLSAETLAQVHFCLRKTGHLTEYAILALLLRRALGRGANFNSAKSTLFVSTLVACVLLAICDEFRQSFVASRGASPWDVLIDSVGTIFGLLIYTGFARLKTSLNKSSCKTGSK
jgi:VanZ family protein